MTQYSSQAEIQSAMYTLLMPSGVIDAELAALGLNAVYDWRNVPQNAVFDYATIGDGYEMPNDTLGETEADGWIYYPKIHIWTRQRNTENPNFMISRMHELLHRKQLALASLYSVSCRSYRTDKLDGGDGFTQHIVLTYVCYTTQ